MITTTAISWIVVYGTSGGRPKSRGRRSRQLASAAIASAASSTARVNPSFMARFRVHGLANTCWLW
jgi:hypothetical protein